MKIISVSFVENATLESNWSYILTKSIDVKFVKLLFSQKMFCNGISVQVKHANANTVRMLLIMVGLNNTWI